jgi:NitT/TauT family transport system substrate-binding protein
MEATMSRFSILWAASAVIGASVAHVSVAGAQTDVNLRLDWSLYGAHAPFYLGLEEGLYEKAGLNVTVAEGQGSATVSKLVAQGGDQFGFIDFSTMIRGV